jgi:hypothetical protein
MLRLFEFSVDFKCGETKRVRKMFVLAGDLTNAETRLDMELEENHMDVVDYSYIDAHDLII